MTKSYKEYQKEMNGKHTAQHQPSRSARRLTAGLTHEAMPPGGFGTLAVSRENEPKGKLKSGKVSLVDFVTPDQWPPNGTKPEASEKAVTRRNDTKRRLAAREHTVRRH